MAGGTLTLTEAVDALAKVAASAGADPSAARAEGLALAAAVAESSPRASTDWADAAGTGVSTQDFFDAASRGRRWRQSPTTTLSALAAQGSPLAGDYARGLAEVASSACLLGEPTMRVIGNASVAAAAQLGAVPVGRDAAAPSRTEPPRATAVADGVRRRRRPVGALRQAAAPSPRRRASRSCWPSSTG